MLAWTLSQERGMTLISPLHSIGNLICNCRQCRPMARKNPNFVLKCALWGKKTVLKLYIVIHSFQKLESRLRRQFVLFRRKIVRERENYQFCNMLETRSLGALRAPTSNWRPFRILDFVLCALWALRPVRLARLRSGPVKIGHFFNRAFFYNRAFF